MRVFVWQIDICSGSRQLEAHKGEKKGGTFSPQLIEKKRGTFSPPQLIAAPFLGAVLPLNSLASLWLFHVQIRARGNLLLSCSVNIYV